MRNFCKACAIVVFAAHAAHIHAAPRKQTPGGVKVAAVVPSAELKAAMKPYGFKAYRGTDGTNVFHCLHAAPQARSSKGLPMVVYIPGNGERGDLLRQFRQPVLFNHVLSRDFQGQHPCHLLAISPPESADTLLGGLPGRPNAYQRLMHEMVREVARRAVPKVDLSRIYVTGFSYGGDGAYALALHFPETFAAAVPVAALPPVEEYLDPRHPGNLWDVYNEGDRMAGGKADLARQRFRSLTIAAGGDFRLSTYPAAGHNAWNKAWHEDEIWNWMFSKTSASAGVVRRPVGPVAAPLSLSDARCTASVSGRDTTCGPERALDGLDDTAYVPVRGFRKTDWWQVEFTKPVSGKIALYSGDKNGTSRLRNAVVEISSNGKSWRRMASFSSKDGTCTFTSQQGFTLLRVRPLGDGVQPFMLRRMTLLASAR